MITLSRGAHIRAVIKTFSHGDKKGRRFPRRKGCRWKRKRERAGQKVRQDKTSGYGRRDETRPPFFEPNRPARAFHRDDSAPQRVAGLFLRAETWEQLGRVEGERVIFLLSIRKY